jgi:co-chaperonin GroES (HSP10)
MSDLHNTPFTPKLTSQDSPFTPVGEKAFLEQEIGVDLIVHGYRVLLKAITLPEKTKSGLILSEVMRNMERRAYNIGLVLKMGNQAYQPLDKFGGAPYCKVGDWVYYSSYERDEVNINNHLCYFINDERIYATLSEADLSKIIPELERYK